MTRRFTIGQFQNRPQLRSGRSLCLGNRFCRGTESGDLPLVQGGLGLGFSIVPDRQDHDQEELGLKFKPEASFGSQSIHNYRPSLANYPSLVFGGWCGEMLAKLTRKLAGMISEIHNFTIVTNGGEGHWLRSMLT